MGNINIDSPRAKFDAAKKAVDGILAKAKGRELTTTELDECDKQLTIAEELKPQIAASDRATSLVGDLADGGVPQLAAGHTDGQDGMDYATREAKRWAAQAMTDLQSLAAKRGGFDGFAGAPQGLKALLGGTVVLGGLMTDTVTAPMAPTSVLELIQRVPNLPRAGDDDGNSSYTHLTETTTTNLANSVADGAQKPTSVITFTEVSNRFRTIAELTQPLPERYLQDFPKLLDVLEMRLGQFLIEAVERDVLTGDASVGTPRDSWNGLAFTSGVQTSTNAGDLLKTLTNAKILLTSVGLRPTALVMAPADLQRYESMRVSGTSGALMWPGGRTQIAEWLGIDSVLTSTKLTAATAGVVGTAWLGEWAQAKLRVRQEATLAIIQPASLAETNEFKMRLETRAGFDVSRPAAFCKISTDLTTIV
jgi:hypothetical protein